jgi:hypothetical protein
MSPVWGWFTLAFALLGFAWAGANPPAAAPDEHAHFVKAYATGSGQLLGEVRVSSPDRSVSKEAEGRSAEWMGVTTRWFRIPARLLPPTSAFCFAFDRERTADCQNFGESRWGDIEVAAGTHVGTYSPFPYVVPGLAAQGAPTFQAAMWRGRIAGLAVCTLFLGWAAMLLQRRGLYSLIGLVCVTTPMVVFLSSSLNTSGLEITAAMLFWAAAITVMRDPGGSTAAAWTAFAVGGITLSMTRPLGAILLGVSVPFIVCFAGIPNVLGGLRRTPHAATVAITLVAISCMASLYWAHAAIPHPSIDFGLAVSSLGEAVKDLPNQAREVVGIFGWNDTTMPLPAYLLGLLFLGSLGVLGLAFGSTPERLTIVGLSLAIVSINIALAVFVEAQIGFGMQARYLMPLVVGLCLMSGDVLQRQSKRQFSRATGYRLAAATFAASALLHVVGFLSNQHRYAVGTSASWAIPWPSRWSPEGGLMLWTIVAAIGCAVLAAAAVKVLRQSRDGSEAHP